MGWDLVSGLIGGTSKDNTTSSCDDKVPPPPSGAFAPPPVPPRGLGSNVSKNPRDLTFNGFTPPPKATVDTSYDASDYSSYTFSDNYNSYTKKEGLVDRIVKNPRAHNCLESIKMGFKMGGAVGGIFGGITGIYSSFRYRNFMILPVSTIGGMVSFGFFLGCGMIVRC